jgi:hypothetical protein
VLKLRLTLCHFRWISKTTCSKADDEDDDIHDIQLNFANFKGLFIVLGIFYGVSYVVLFVKLAALKLKDRHEVRSRLTPSILILPEKKCVSVFSVALVSYVDSSMP